mmetsp:Transcript_111134/g.313570  ORF Transcript_111134/g.313570 Transcript_111134/m.313570 type:complete len:201 (+) Transcript_111134:413-1015(+)
MAISYGSMALSAATGASVCILRKRRSAFDFASCWIFFIASPHSSSTVAFNILSAASRLRRRRASRMLLTRLSAALACSAASTASLAALSASNRLEAATFASFAAARAAAAASSVPRSASFTHSTSFALSSAVDPSSSAEAVGSASRRADDAKALAPRPLRPSRALAVEAWRAARKCVANAGTSIGALAFPPASCTNNASP